MNVYIFTSPACIPCQTLKPVFEDLKEEFPILQWSHVNLRENPELTEKYGIKIVPSIAVISDEGVETLTSVNPMEYYKFLRSILK
jgi:thiol-disulfide isomerase/thioredoxin